MPCAGPSAAGAVPALSLLRNICLALIFFDGGCGGLTSGSFLARPTVAPPPAPYGVMPLGPVEPPRSGVGPPPDVAPPRPPVGVGGPAMTSGPPPAPDSVEVPTADPAAVPPPSGRAVGCHVITTAIAIPAAAATLAAAMNHERLVRFLEIVDTDGRAGSPSGSRWTKIVGASVASPPASSRKVRRKSVSSGFARRAVNRSVFASSARPSPRRTVESDSTRCVEAAISAAVASMLTRDPARKAASASRISSALA